MAFYRCNAASGSSTSEVKYGSYTTSNTTSVSVSIGFDPDVVVVWQSPGDARGFFAESRSKGSFSGKTWASTTAGTNIGTFTWSGTSFTHKAYNSQMSGMTAYYMAYKA